MFPRICHVNKLMLSRTKRTEPSARQTFTPPGCWLREGTIPTQLSQDKPAPPTPASPAPLRHFQLGGAEVLNSALLWLCHAQNRPLLVRIRAAGAAATTSSSACVGKARLATLIA